MPTKKTAVNTGDELVARARKLVKEYSNGCLYLAEVLHEIRRPSILNDAGKKVPIWRARGYKSFKAFVEIELHLGYSAAMKYIQAYTTFVVRYHYTIGDLPLISKLLCILPIVNPKNHLLWVNRALKLNFQDLYNAVMRERTGLTKRFHVMTFRVDEASFDMINHGISLMQAENPGFVRGTALACVVSEYVERCEKRSKKTG